MGVSKSAASNVSTRCAARRLRVPDRGAAWAPLVASIKTWLLGVRVRVVPHFPRLDDRGNKSQFGHDWQPEPQGPAASLARSHGATGHATPPRGRLPRRRRLAPQTDDDRAASLTEHRDRVSCQTEVGGAGQDHDADVADRGSTLQPARRGDRRGVGDDHWSRSGTCGRGAVRIDVPTRVVGVVRGLLRLVVEGDAERRGGDLRLAIGTRGPRQRRRGRGAVGAGGTGRHATARERLDLDDVADRALDPVAQPRHRVVTARTDLREEYPYAGGEEVARRGPEREERLVTEGAPETRRV